MAIYTVILKAFLRYLLGILWKETLRDCRQHLDLMGTSNHRQQKGQSYSHKETNSAKAKRVWKQILSQSNFQMRMQSSLHLDCSL
ncbi:D-amino acid oxidase activator [Diceros bicornis minor]|uniref:D-amino acid oxidase activator n=1 Tax=Diceros bicornis minor TaxID=77932 RepID=UPI0026EB7C70|nr:D-amino acid oxidase activator [Diceros bicornis minor]